MKLPTKLIFCFMLISCFTYGQGRDTLNSRVSISFSSGVARSYVDYSYVLKPLSFKDEAYKGKSSLYYKMAIEERLFRILSIQQTFVYQSFEFKDSKESYSQSESCYYGYSHSAPICYQTVLYTKSRVKYSQFSFGLNTKLNVFTHKKLNVALVFGPQINNFNLKQKWLFYRAPSETEYQETYFRYSELKNSFFTMGYFTGLEIGYKISERIRIKIESGINNANFFRKYSPIIYYNYSCGVGVVKTFRISKRKNKSKAI